MIVLWTKMIKGKQPKKITKNITHCASYGDESQQILVCEPQKTDHFWTVRFLTPKSGQNCCERRQDSKHNV